MTLFRSCDRRTKRRQSVSLADPLFVEATLSRQTRFFDQLQELACGEVDLASSEPSL